MKRIVSAVIDAAWLALDKPEDIRNAIDSDVERELIEQKPEQVYVTRNDKSE